MDDRPQVRDRLTTVADDIDDAVAPPPLTAFLNRRRTRRRAVASIAGAVVVVLGVTAAVTLTRGKSARHVARPAPSTSPSAPVPTSSVAPSKLVAGRWTRLPKAPIAGRSGAATAWTGSQMLVWGGYENGWGHDLSATGAGYDPVTRKWSILPPAPLGPRAASSAIWTGDRFIVWGGIGASGSVADGALFDPARHTWQHMAAPPSSIAAAGKSAQNFGTSASWTGDRLVIVGVSVDRTSLVAAAYDPSTNHWTELADHALASPRSANQFAAVATGSTVYVEVSWSHVRRISANSTSTEFGVDWFVLDPKNDDWRQDDRLPTRRFGQPLWTGRDIVIPALRNACPCSQPVARNLSGLIVDTVGGDPKPIPHGPVDDLGGRYLWTGVGLLDFDTTTAISGGGPRVDAHPGEAAFWDRSTNAWTVLPSAPLFAADPGTDSAVWTGSQLIIWGTMAKRDPRYRFPSGARYSEVTAGFAFGA